MTYSPTTAPIKITKLQGAANQISAAIDALERGQFDVAITLAGAAEGMLPEIDTQPLFATLRDAPERPSSISQKAWISALNAERDWLKHSTTEVGDEIDITIYDASIMVLRALARLPEWNSRMDEFKAWAMQNGLATRRVAE